MVSCARRPAPDPRFPAVRALWLVVAMIFAGFAPGVASAAGQWTPGLTPMGGEARHIVLMPGEGTHHSRVLWWQDHTIGRVLGWDPANSACAQDALAGFTDLGAWTPAANVFCSGHTQLSGADAAGQLLTVGGFGDKPDWGLRDARMYKVSPGAGVWTARARPRWPRWYPSVTTLSDGRAIVSGGSKGEQIWFFGGRRNGSPPTGGTGDELHRFGRVTGVAGAANGYWEDPKSPDAFAGTPPRPLAREGHASALLADRNAQAILGGRGESGDLLLDGPLVWLLKREDGDLLASDYTYRWDRIPVVATPRPDGRTEHTAVAISGTEILVFGGIRNPSGLGETPSDELWRLYKDGFGVWRWVQMQQYGTPPGARYGHAAVHDPAGSRMLVYGGSEELNGAPADPRVWALHIPTATWSELTATGAPAPRRDHIMVLDPNTPAGSRSLLVYGGYVPGGPPDETLWRLDLGPDPAWSPIAVTGTTPGAREGHAGYYDDYGLNGGRLFIHGGDPAGLDTYVRVIDPFAGTPEWRAWQNTTFHLAQHTATGDVASPILSVRVPEIYSPATDSWTALPTAGWLQTYERYPVQFLVPGTTVPEGGGRIVTAGIQKQARYLDISGPGGWQQVGTGTSGDAGFFPFSGVLYRPDRIMIAGGNSAQFLGAADGTTRRLDAWGLPAGWTPSGSMLPRAHHNLVALPTGQVLALGGMTLVANGFSSPGNAQSCPQIWAPETDTWTGEGDLECDRVLEGGVPRNVVRNYHSVAMLLPCGRVLNASGHLHADALTARIFCPPYLFKSDGTSADALRPQITGSPATLGYRKGFTICTPDPSRITRVSLIRPAATTHGFDANQRYVPLDFTVAESGPPRLFVTAPASPDSAPPGDYLLFLTGAYDDATSTLYPDVPSIARWIRLQAPTGADLCDVVAPAPITGFTADIVGSNQIWFTWTGPGDDGQISASGPPTSFELSGSSDESVPGLAGSPGWGTVAGLHPCTWYNFTVSAWDDHQQQSTPVALAVETTCGGGGGSGESSAREVSGHEEGGAGSAAGSAPTAGAAPTALAASGRGATPTASAASLQSTTGLLVVDTRREGERGWRVTLHLRETPAGADPPLATITVEPGGGAPADTLGRFEPSAAEHLLGLCSLRERGRLGIPGVHRLERVVPGLRTRDGDHALTAALHSRLGPLAGGFLAAGGGVEMVPGDSLELLYTATPAPLADAASWYVLVRRSSDAPPIPMGSRRGRVGETPPARFALHQNRPNPFRGTTTIAFDLPVESPVTLEVFDLLGRRVAVLADATHAAGRHSVEWDLRDLAGARVRPGVYAYRLTAGEYRERRKMNVLE